MLNVRGSEPSPAAEGGLRGDKPHRRTTSRHTKKKRPLEFPRAAVLRSVTPNVGLDAPPLYVAARPGVLPSVRAPGARPTPAAPDVGAPTATPGSIRGRFARRCRA